MAMAHTEAVQADQAISFESFFEANYERLLRAVYLITGGDAHEAEDLAQEAFVKALERWERISVGSNPAGYLYRTALNSYRSRLRRMAVAARKVLVGHSDDPVSASDDRDALRRALRGIPGGQREALVLVEWLGMTDVEAAAVLGTSPGAIRVRLTRARTALRVQLRGESDD